MVRNNLTWIEAAEKVLNEERKQLHYADITQLILERGYKATDKATPNLTVNRDINQDIKKKGDQSVFKSVGPGIFILRAFENNIESSNAFPDSDTSTTGPSIIDKRSFKSVDKIINSIGIYWDRFLVHYKSIPDLYGVQHVGAKTVNFKMQKGIYLLHDGRETIYVGQAIEEPLAVRLRHHTVDRLSSRWNRFSWFGFYGVQDDGNLVCDMNLSNLHLQHIGDVLEAILIESIEPRQNRKQGNTFAGIEFLQQEDPIIKKKNAEQILNELKSKI